MLLALLDVLGKTFDVVVGLLLAIVLLVVGGGIGTLVALAMLKTKPAAAPKTRPR